MYHLIMRLKQGEDELLRRITRDVPEQLMGPIPATPEPGPPKAQRQRSRKPRERPETPVADALAAFRAFLARRHAKGDSAA
jgi:hypothetical protein